MHRLSSVESQILNVHRARVQRMLTAHQQARARVLAALQAVANSGRELRAAHHELEVFAGDVAQRARDYYADRSDTWKDSPRGEAYEAWVDGWESHPDLTVESVAEFLGAPFLEELVVAENTGHLHRWRKTPAPDEDEP